MPDIYRVLNEKKHLFPVVVSMAHSGTKIPADIRRQFIRPTPPLANTDWYLNELYSFLNAKGVTVLQSKYSRYVIDLNRPIKTHPTGKYQNDLVYTKTTFERDLYPENLTSPEIEKRIRLYYEPYHKKLQELITQKSQFFPCVFVLDLHSGYNSTGTNDICIGNAGGLTASDKTTNTLKTCFEQNHFTVGINHPVTGGYIIRKHHDKNVHSLMFEINYKSYIENRYFAEEQNPVLNEKLFKETRGRLQKTLFDFFQQLPVD